MLLPSGDMVKRVFAMHIVARTTSTQDVVRRAARSGAADGFCCVADEQTAGRGRLGRAWVAPPRTALLASVLLRVPEAAAPGVPFAAGLAMRDAIAEITGVESLLKWPNDLLVGGHKLAGILVELCSPLGNAPSADAAAGAALIVGVGVNLTVPEFPPGVDAVSLHTLVGHPPEARRLLDAWLSNLDRRTSELDAAGLPVLLAHWRRWAAGLGSPVSVRMPAGSVEGVAEDVRDDGALLVRTAGGVIPVLAGDVHLLPGLPQPPPMPQG
jgi:BirA family biotin operon repressor/biotin-[acetyl-CoA-carboxylase] ligase